MPRSIRDRALVLSGLACLVVALVAPGAAAQAPPPEAQRELFCPPVCLPDCEDILPVELCEDGCFIICLPDCLPDCSPGCPPACPTVEPSASVDPSESASAGPSESASAVPSESVSAVPSESVSVEPNGSASAEPGESVEPSESAEPVDISESPELEPGTELVEETPGPTGSATVLGVRIERPAPFLPATGGPHGILAGAGLGLVAAGAVLILQARDRRPRHGLR